DHSESAPRIEAILTLLEEARLLDRLHHIEPRSATDDDLALVHHPRYLAALRRACAEGGGWVDFDTYLVPGSFAAAAQAAGACLAAVDAVLAGDVRSAFCAVRPPGHHARPPQGMGFCLLNNVAVAAQYARTRRGLDRVAIVDLDVHHGNGTQDAFYADPNVLYISTHQYPYYPGTGALDETGPDGPPSGGAGIGVGATVNLPLPPGSGDDQYRAAFEQVIEPVVRRFRPQLILVSQGFDAHHADPIAFLSLSVAGYGECAARLRALADELCDGRIIFVLEGGYDLTALSWGVRHIIELLLDLPPTPDPLGPTPTPGPDISALLSEVQRVHNLG
ncbi:MAG: histone deacetylase, partial [Dehalococcoidia bacterium]